MRVCLVAFQFWPDVGGAQSQAEKYARYLQQLGQDVLVITLRHQQLWPRNEQYAEVPVIRVSGFYRRGTLCLGNVGYLLVNLLLLLTLWRLRRRYDLIHTFQVSPLAAVATLIGKLTRKPVLVGVHSTGPYEPSSDLSDADVTTLPGRTCALELDSAVPAYASSACEGDLATLERTIWGGRHMLAYLRRSNAYYHIRSSRSYLYLVQHGFQQERIVYIPNGVDTRQFAPLVWQREDFQADVYILLCVAHLEHARGIDLLLRAWAQLMDQPAGWRTHFIPKLQLVGDGSDRASLEALACTLGIQQSVEFLGIRHDIAYLMQDARAFVLPSRWEGMSNSLLEAMASALPCVATRVDGSEDVIEQGVNGLLVEPGEVVSLAYALRLLLGDCDLARKLGKGAYETVQHSYRMDMVAQGCVAFYRYLLTRPRPPRSLVQDSEHLLDPYPEEWQRYE